MVKTTVNVIVTVGCNRLCGTYTYAANQLHYREEVGRLKLKRMNRGSCCIFDGTSIFKRLTLNCK